MSFHTAPNRYVSQIHLSVMNLQRSEIFYQDLLGFRVLKKEQGTITFSANGTDPLITLEQPAGIQPHRSRQAGLYHFALLLPSRRDLATLLYRILKEDYPLQGGSDHAVSEAVYLADPDGNGIELYRDRPAAEWKWENGRVYMTTDAIDEHILDERDERGWSGMPKNTIMGHIHLQVADLNAAERFYCQGLGFQLVAQYGDQADFLSTGGYHHHIGLNVWMSKGRPADSALTAGMKDFTLEYPDSATRAKAIARVKEMGFPVSEEKGGVRITDPSRIDIILHVNE
ncbi:VOC family protein [Sporolactobacillus vineae]|uniref:VOC family protein n=1 Tax=Sporolactobacillus vineae TaxID=444463 RepID=UPI00028A241B|nr:VOC family protein [Sporolactobacillus vineae]